MKKSLAFAVAALLASIALAGCGGSADPAPAATELSAEERASDPLGSIASDVDADGLEVKMNGKNLHAQFQIRDEKRMYLTVDAAQQATIDILRNAFDSGLEYKRVFVQGMFPVTDQSGHTEKSMVLNAAYDLATVEGIDFGKVRKGDIWELRDAGQIHKDLHK